MKKVAIIGSRNYPNEDAIRKAVMELGKGTILVTGAWWGDDDLRISPTRGADRMAAFAASHHHVVVLVAGPVGGGKAAGLIRNPTIADIADECIAFWDKESNGTMKTVEHFRELGKSVRLYGPSGEEIA